MRILHEHTDVKWLPSRYRFALAKLIAIVAMRRVTRNDVDVQNVLAIDRDQSAVENHAVAMWVYVTATAYLLDVTPPVAWIVVPFVAPLVLHLPMFVFGWVAGLFGGIDNRKLNSVATMAALTIASSYFAATEGPVQFVAWFFFAVLALNGLAAVVLWIVRGTAATVEPRCEA